MGKFVDKETIIDTPWLNSIDEHWQDVSIHFADVPIDGVEYTRKDGAWIPNSGGGGGETNTASNAGAGEGLVLTKVGVDMPFKSLVAGSGITLTPSADTLAIEAEVAVGAIHADFANDDHTQYHTDARGDARYYLQSQVDSAVAPKIEADDYAGATVGGTLKARLSGTTLYLSNNGSNP